MIFHFLHSNVYEGEVVSLKKSGTDEASSANSQVQSIYFDICLQRGGMKIGECDLRLGMNKELYYAGNIGYRIYDGWRGHHYAYEACRILFQVAKEKYHMQELLVTCSPDNIASHKTLERLGGTLIEEVDVPQWHWLYRRGEVRKEIWKYVL